MCKTNIKTVKERNPWGSRRHGVQVCRKLLLTGEETGWQRKSISGFRWILSLPLPLPPISLGEPLFTLSSQTNQENSAGPALANWGDQNSRRHPYGRGWRWGRKRLKCAAIVSGPWTCLNGWRVSERWYLCTPGQVAEAGVLSVPEGSLPAESEFTQIHVFTQSCQ